MGLGPFPEDATPNPSLQDQAKHHIVNLRSQPPFSSQNGGGDNPVGDRSNAQMTFSPGLPSRSPRRRTGIMSPPYQVSTGIFYFPVVIFPYVRIWFYIIVIVTKMPANSDIF
ncbi:unnamed protein product [Mesocestoides corti]|uniref:Uncharacterized protein n=1 Tax=Mesocestoides corti TaxID=53468 RepID=A0A0R3UB39_MESCO|nr:unnamed protein product [Mesocestoides corti]